LGCNRGYGIDGVSVQEKLEWLKNQPERPKIYVPPKKNYSYFLLVIVCPQIVFLLDYGSEIGTR
jgi:2-keto-4-pentenoate hydratase/2-oxohepta-3-ene-1,7-dioic acid hydratase in catechol pathway